MKKRRPTRGDARRERIRTLNVNHGSNHGGRSIPVEVYEEAKRAILESVPRDEKGITFPELLSLVRQRVPRQVFDGRNVNWYATFVKLDLEARGLITRVQGSRPQRLVRSGGSA